MGAEVLFRVNTAPSGRGGLDGDPLVVKPPGVHWTGAQVETFVNPDGTGLGQRPPGWALLAPFEKDLHENRMLQYRWLLEDPDEPDIERVLGVTREVARGMLTLDWERTKVHGYDTNWGFRDLEDFGVMLIDLDIRDAEDLVSPEMDQSGHPCALKHIKRKRRYRLKYDELLSSSSVTRLQTADLRVNVPRGVPVLDRAQCFEERVGSTPVQPDRGGR